MNKSAPYRGLDDSQTRIIKPLDCIRKIPHQDPTNVPLEEAINIVQTIAHTTGTETIPVDEADGRIFIKVILRLNPGFRDYKK